jgi:hypothetical protein
MVKEALTNFQMFYGLPQTGKSNCVYISHAWNKGHMYHITG